jgi:hypothetical protein
MGVTVALRLGLVVVAAFVVVSASSASRSTLRDVAFVTLTGKGTVVSTPAGIRCPGRCRAVFPRGTHVRFVARASSGWRFRGFSSTHCNGGATCAFDLVSDHDCVGGACPTGAFGVRAAFVRTGG